VGELSAFNNHFPKEFTVSFEECSTQRELPVHQCHLVALLEFRVADDQKKCGGYHLELPSEVRLEINAP
jgi:hypothetical protein